MNPNISLAQAISDAAVLDGSTRTISAVVLEIGSGTVDVKLTGGSSPRKNKIPLIGGPVLVGDQVTLIANPDGLLEAHATGASTAPGSGGGLTVMNFVSGTGGGGGPPLAHASSHGTAGLDPLTPGGIGTLTTAQIEALVTAHKAEGNPHDHANLGGLAGDDHTQYLLTNGSRTLTGSQTTQALLPSATNLYDIGSLTNWYRRGYLSELYGLRFVEETIQTIGGKLMIAKASGTLPTDLSNVATTYDFGITLTSGDIILLQLPGQIEYIGYVGAGVVQEFRTGYIWWIPHQVEVPGGADVITRNLDGSGANSWPRGTVFVVLGQANAGRIEFDATTTPRISVKLQGATWNSVIERLRLGDLNGSFGVVTEKYGLGVGDYAAGNYMLYDGSDLKLAAAGGDVTIDSEGLRINNGTSSSSIIKWMANNSGSVRQIAYLYSWGSDLLGYYLDLSSDVKDQAASLSLSASTSSEDPGTPTHNSAGILLNALAPDYTGSIVTILALSGDHYNRVTRFIGYDGGSFDGLIVNSPDSSESPTAVLDVRGSGSFSGVVYPYTDDGSALGSTSKRWSDLFLASGGVINWAAGDVTLTHSTGLLTLSGGLTLADAKNISFGTTTGTQLGTATTQKLAFYGSTPVAQRASADQAAAPAGGTGATAGAYDTAAHRDALIALVNEMRTVLVNLGLMKGAA